jgi:hypothetical protein
MGSRFDEWGAFRWGLGGRTRRLLCDRSAIDAAFYEDKVNGKNPGLNRAGSEPPPLRLLRSWFGLLLIAGV